MSDYTAVQQPPRKIQRVRSWAAEAEAFGRKHYPGMSYEEGVLAAIDWLFGDRREAPDEDS